MDRVLVTPTETYNLLVSGSYIELHLAVSFYESMFWNSMYMVLDLFPAGVFLKGFSPLSLFPTVFFSIGLFQSSVFPARFFQFISLPAGIFLLIFSNKEINQNKSNQAKQNWKLI